MPTKDDFKNQNDLELIGRDLIEFWRALENHLHCFRASRGLNLPRFEPGPSELEFSALPTEVSDT
jgi:hypothetical protein